MTPDHPLNHVNAHWLERLLAMAACSRVRAVDDVLTADGVCLLAKDELLSPVLKAALLGGPLLRPLEATLDVVGAVDGARLQDMAHQVLHSDGKVQPLLQMNGLGGRAAGWLEQLPVSGSLGLLLTMLDQSGQGELRSAVEGALVALVLGLQCGVHESNLPALAAGALLHDIGELYLDPAAMRPGASLRPAEWRYLASHPLIGKRVLDELLPDWPLAGQIVLEHHERLDGSGYPRRIAGDQMSLEGQIAGVADTVCAVFRHYGRPLARAEIAMRIIPGQFPAQVTSIVSQVLRTAAPVAISDADLPSIDTMADSMHQLLARLARVLITLDDVLENEQVQRFKPALLLTQRAGERINLIQRAFSSTGLDSLSEAEKLALFQQDDPELHFEVIVAIEEIVWRLRELGRDLQLRREHLPEDMRSHFEPLIAALHSAHG